MVMLGRGEGGDVSAKQDGGGGGGRRGAQE